MPDMRTVARTTRGIPATEGAGVRIRRFIGTPELDGLDPFLLLDEFRSDRPDDYLAGFPEHPHRGFETVTYMLEGRMRHRDSTGTEGLLGPGAVQWMTAGRGIVHSEMPQMERGLMWGYQLWVNLPGSLKMIEPAYQDIPAERIPEVDDDGCTVRVIAGEHAGQVGAADTRIGVDYLDARLGPDSAFEHPAPAERNAFVYLIAGVAEIAGRRLEAGELAVLGPGERIVLTSGGDGARLLVLTGQRLDEPVARYGPFVMNSREEIMQAVSDFRAGRLR